MSSSQKEWVPFQSGTSSRNRHHPFLGSETRLCLEQWLMLGLGRRYRFLCATLIQGHGLVVAVVVVAVVLEPFVRRSLQEDPSEGVMMDRTWI